MALRTRKEFFSCHTAISTEQLYRSSTLVSTLTGSLVQKNKAIVGENAFAHEAGIHQDGVLKNPLTYEIMTPESIGVPTSRLVLGKHSGRHAFKDRLEEMGYLLSTEDLQKAYERFLEVADKKKEITDMDLEALVRGEISMVDDYFVLDYFHVTSGNKTIPTATVRLKTKDQVIQEAACGDGPVDAAYKAMERITGIQLKLQEYSIKAVTGGKDALGEVTVRVKTNGHTFSGRGVSTDIIEASARAYLNAVNRVVRHQAVAEEN
jgi:2-isopropylmalate synthase